VLLDGDANRIEIEQGNPFAFVEVHNTSTLDVAGAFNNVTIRQVTPDDTSRGGSNVSGVTIVGNGNAVGVVQN
jgi:hypothetical protein